MCESTLILMVSLTEGALGKQGLPAVVCGKDKAKSGGKKTRRRSVGSTGDGKSGREGYHRCSTSELSARLGD